MPGLIYAQSRLDPPLQTDPFCAKTWIQLANEWEIKICGDRKKIHIFQEYKSTRSETLSFLNTIKHNLTKAWWGNAHACCRRLYRRSDISLAFRDEFVGPLYGHLEHMLNNIECIELTELNTTYQNS